MYYSKDGAYPRPVPSTLRIRLPDGSTRTDINQITQAELDAAGVVLVSNPPAVGQFERLGWDGIQWTVTSWPQSEIDEFNAREAEKAQKRLEESLAREAVVTDNQVRALLKATPEQIETYVNTNVDSLASAKTVIAAIAKAVSVVGKDLFRNQP